MQFCGEHWMHLRNEIDARGLTPFIAKSGEFAVKQLVKELKSGEVTKETFDPLMSAHWAVVNNTIRFLTKAGGNPLYFLSAGPEDPVQGYPGYETRTWPKCPLCYINLAHEVSCTSPTCELPKVNGYDWMIERAAEDALTRAREFGLVA